MVNPRKGGTRNKAIDPRVKVTCEKRLVWGRECRVNEVLEGLGAVVYSYAKFALVRPLPLFFAGNLQVQG